MGRNNRSRKRRDEMNRVKRARNTAKELQHLKKTLGLLDTDGNEIMKEVEELVTIKTAKQLKKEKEKKEEKFMEEELAQELSKGEEVVVVNEKTGKTHKYNTKTMRDQHGNYPVWYNKKNTPKRIRKRDHNRIKNFKQQWTNSVVPL